MKLYGFAIAVLAIVLGVISGPAFAAGAAGADGFAQFQKKEIQGLRDFQRGMNRDGVSRAEARNRIRTYARGMIERTETFRDSDEGKSHAAEANRFLIDLAFHLAGDQKKIDAILASEKDPTAAAYLKLHAATTISQQHPDKAKDMIEGVLAASKGTHPDLYEKAQAALFRVAPQGLAFPEFPEDTRDLEGKPIRIADYKGKVVLVDFWASWCGPCIQEAPNVVNAYKKYHPKGFEIIGISLDQSKDQLFSTTKKHGMSWRQYFDGKGWQNKVGTNYGVSSIPAMYLVGKDGRIISNNARGPNLEKAIAKALAAK